MASNAPAYRAARTIPARRRLAFRLLDDRNFLGIALIAPAAAFLLVFLAYPLGLGFWLGMTDASIGQPGRFIGLRNFISLAHDSVFWLSVFNTLLYTVVASALKFALGLYLALLLKLGLIHQYIDFLGSPWNARWSVIAANVWRGIPFVAITLLAGLQTISPSLYEAATLDGAGPWQRFRFVTLPMLSPIIAVVMTFSVLLTFTDFQLIYAITRGGPINATQLMATLSYQRAITEGRLGEGAAIADAMVPFLLAAILFSYFGLQRRRWQQGSRD